VKKYSKDYFEKRFHLLYEKLVNKENFVETVIKARKLLNIPEKGFESSFELVEYLISRIPKDEIESHMFYSFCMEYEDKTGLKLKENQFDEFSENFYQKYKGKYNDTQSIALRYQEDIENHQILFTHSLSILLNDKNIVLKEKVKEIFDFFMEVELLDAHIISHFIEKYLFLGDKGVCNYINKRILCSSCRYYSISHFSPKRYDMQNQEDGPFSGKYFFNKETSRMLSNFFDSYFLFIKPYAQKGEVLSYIEDNWDTIKKDLNEKNSFYKQFEFKPSRLRKSDYKKNRLIYELNKKSKKELLDICIDKQSFPAQGVYKEEIISQILKEKYGWEMSNDAIKKTATRFRKSIKTKKTAKNIRDI
jgi:hypothetical protein